MGAAERLIEEDRPIAEATGNPPVGYAMLLAAWRARETEEPAATLAAWKMPGIGPGSPGSPGCHICSERNIDAANVCQSAA